MSADSRIAFGELLETLQEVGTRFAGDEWMVTAPDDVAEGLRSILHLLATGMETQFEDDPGHPVFHEIVTPWRKVLGDNPDARYHDVAVHPAGTYQVRGRIGGAIYVSFTVEAGAADGGMPERTAGVLNDSDFDVAEDGWFGITIGGPPQERGWLPLPDDASRITVRHYWERMALPAVPPAPSLGLTIELIDGEVPERPVPPSDAVVAASIRRMATFVRSRTLESIPPPGSGDPPPFVSRVPNEFAPPVPPGDHALAAADAAYSMAPYFLNPDEALVMKVRWPKCRYGGVALWNRQLQTFDYLRGVVSLNRTQAFTDEDGTTTVVIAHRDPGVPNWLTTEGRPFGLVFWRFLLAEGPIEPISAVVAAVDSLSSR
ncbi:MAG TPA: hypothetical protein VHV76_10260 [Mycobacteriales bacterium]|jgi:hypothetical protein|nr:hypothetical protein [Mycobacteriales bacterium]